MQKLDWLLDLLQGDLDSAEKKVTDTVPTLEKDSVLNLLAIKLLKRDYEGIISVSERFLEDQLDIYDENNVKILEYRLVASILVNDFTKILDTLRRIRTKILIISPVSTLAHKIGSWYELLSEQRVTNLRRQIVQDYLKEEPFSKFALALITKLLRNDRLSGLDPVIRQELVSYLIALMAHTPFAKEALAKLRQYSTGENDYNLLTAKGKVLFFLNKPTVALGLFTKAVALAGDMKDKFEALINISQIYALYGEFKLALEYVKQALLIRQDPVARLLRGAILLNIGSYDEASLAFRALIQVRDKKIKLLALFGLSECYIAKGNFRAAFDSIWKAYMLYPNELVRIYANVLKRCIGS